MPEIEVVTVDGSGERLVLIGMIMDRRVLAKVSQVWQRGLFPSPLGELIGGWCIEHYRNPAYKSSAPCLGILDIFNKWAEYEQDSKKIEPVQELLDSLLEQHNKRGSEPNTQHVIERAWEVFEKKRMATVRDKVNAYLDRGQIKEASEEFKKYRPLGFNSDSSVNVLTDHAEAEDALTRETHNLIEFDNDGPIDQFFRGSLCRDQLCCVIGCAKKGKSRFLMDLAVRGMLCGNKVVQIITGDMSKWQAIRRLAERFSERPWRSGPWRVPVSMEQPVGNSKTPVVTYKTRRSPVRLSPAINQGRCAQFVDEYGENAFKLHVPTSISIEGVNDFIQQQKDDGNPPDIVVLDYADLLTPLSNKDRRDQVNEDWRRMRTISQEQHCLFIVGTQANREGLNAGILNASHISEDRRKLDHVSSMFSINQNRTEKAMGLYRLGWVENRDRETENTNDFLWVAGNNGYSSPMIVGMKSQESDS